MPFDRESNQLKYKGYVIDLNDPFASEKAREILALEKAQIRQKKKSRRENITLARKIADDNLKNLKELNETLATIGKDLVDLKQKRKQLHQQALRQGEKLGELHERVDRLWSEAKKLYK